MNTVTNDIISVISFNLNKLFATVCSMDVITPIHCKSIHIRRLDIEFRCRRRDFDPSSIRSKDMEIRIHLRKWKVGNQKIHGMSLSNPFRNADTVLHQCIHIHRNWAVRPIRPDNDRRLDRGGLPIRHSDGSGWAIFLSRLLCAQRFLSCAEYILWCVA